MGEHAPHDDIDRLRFELDGLRKALVNRDVIGQAKGILMERHRLSADEAFLRLVRTSQDANVKLHAVAERIVAAHREGQDDRGTDRESTSVD